MTPQRAERIRTIVLDAAGKDAAAQKAFIAQACAGDAELQAEVERMLEPDAGKGRALPTATLQCARKSAQPEDEAAQRQSRSMPRQIGGYTILRRVGEGGMGVVYEAEQDIPRRIVALKVIRPAYATERMLRRFEFEVQVLGQLEHPGIARIYDAGTAEESTGRFPFFAMEFIQGQPITAYAQGQGLDVRERLELVARACDAVHYAHQKGVIHRDLKPGNILVQPPSENTTDASGTTGGSGEWNVGQPKILDFGVARAIDADVGRDTQHTEAGQLIGTLPYMSPEQIAGDSDAVDARTDVYSLGVVLYEMLTSRLPFELSRRSVIEAAAIVREQEPRPPSAGDAAFRGDIDTIALKALAKDPGRRYDSAAHLAADLRRFLRDEPITARPASAMYTLRKLARRHKAVVTGVVIAALGLVAGTVFAARQAIMARLSELDAIEQRDRARALEATATQQRDRAVRAEQEAVESLKQTEIAKRQADAANQFLRDMLASVDPERTPNHEITMVEVLDGAAKSIGERYKDDPLVEIKVRETIGLTYSNLGRATQAAQQYQVVFDLARAHFGDDDATTHNARTNLALEYREIGKFDEALELARTASEGLNRRLGPNDTNTLAADANLALILLDKGQRERARDMLIDVIRRRTAIDDSASQGYLRNISALASVYDELGQYDLAEPLVREALDKRLATLGSTHPDVITSKNNLARMHMARGELKEAQALLEDVLATAPAAVGPDHPMLFTIMSNLGGIYETMGRSDLSQPLYERSLEQARRMHGEKHPETFSSMNNLAGCYQSLGRTDLAEPLYAAALKGRREILGDDDPDTIASVNNLGFLYRNQKRYREAEPLFAEALQRFTKALGEKHQSTLIAMSNVGNLYNEMGLASEAEPYNEKVYRLCGETMPESHWFRSLAAVRYGVSLAGSSRHEEAERLLLDGRSGLESALGPDNPRTILATREIVKLYEAWPKPEEAAKWRERLPAEPGSE